MIQENTIKQNVFVFLTTFVKSNQKKHFSIFTPFPLLTPSGVEF